MALPRDIKSMKDLRRRKQHLREEIKLSHLAFQYSLDRLVSRGSLRKAILTTTLTGAAAFGLRILNQQQARAREEVQAYAGAAPAEDAPWWVRYLPLLRSAVDYLLDLAESRLSRGR